MNEYLVRTLGGRWSVFCGEFRLGPYIGREAAIAGAVKMARADFSNGIRSIVMLDDDGHLTPAYDSTLPAA